MPKPWPNATVPRFVSVPLDKLVVLHIRAAGEPVTLAELEMQCFGVWNRKAHQSAIRRVLREFERMGTIISVTMAHEQNGRPVTAWARSTRGPRLTPRGRKNAGKRKRDVRAVCRLRYREL